MNTRLLSAVAVSMSIASHLRHRSPSFDGRRVRWHRAVALVLPALLAAHGAQAFDIQAYASTTVSSFFPQTTSDVESSQDPLVTTVSAKQDGPDPGFGTFVSESSVDMGLGKLAGKSIVTNTSAATSPGLVTESTARIQETINLNGVLVPPPSTVVIQTQLITEGNFSAMSGAGNAYSFFSLGLNGSGNYFVVACSSACSQLGSEIVVVNEGPFNPSLTVQSRDPNAWKVTMKLDFTVDPTLPFNLDIQMHSYAESFGIGSATLDASRSASVRLILPDGYGFTSTSGVFLTAVPEPASALLLAAGLAAVGAAARRRRTG